MAKGSFVTNGYTVGGLTCSLEFAWESTGQNMANNTITIYWRLTGVLSDGYKYMMGGPFNITIQGNDRSAGTRVQVRNGQNVTDGVITIPHNADGTCTLSVSVSAAIYTSSTSVSGSGSWALDTIPRASSITSAGNITLGNACSLKWTPAAAGFRYKVKFSLGNWNYTTNYISPNTTSAYTYTGYAPPVSVAAQMPNAVTGTMTATLYTYNSSGDNMIGSASKTFTVTVPTSVVPTVAAPTVTEATSGLANKFAAFVQNKSTLKIVSSPAGAQGSTITECKVTVDGKTYSGTTVTTSAITSSGTVRITVTVKDSRGRTASVTKDISVTAYANPSIAAFTAVRCDADGTANRAGASIKVSANFSISPVGNKNNKSHKIEYRKAGSSDAWTTLASGSVYSYNSSQVYDVSGIFDSAVSYELKLTMTDYFTSSTASANVASAFRLVNFSKTLKSVALGKMAEIENTFECALKALFTEEVRLHKASGDVYYFSKRTDTGVEVAMGVGSGGTNHGLWSNVLKKWLIHGDGTNVYVNNQRVMHGKSANGYWGLVNPDGSDSEWIRTANSGLIPYAPGGASALGTSSWPFNSIYGKAMYSTTVDATGGVKAGSSAARIRFHAFSAVGTVNLYGLFQVATPSQINSWLGVSNSGPTNTAVLVCNGDNDSYGALAMNATYSANSKIWYVGYSNVNSGKSARANCLVVYWG